MKPPRLHISSSVYILQESIATYENIHVLEYVTVHYSSNKLYYYYNLLVCFL